MMKLTAEYLIEVLEKTLNHDEIGEDWDLIGRSALYSKDDFTRYWCERIIKVEDLFPGTRKCDLFHIDGMNYLKEIRDELVRR